MRPTSWTLRRRATGGYRQLARTVEVSLSSSTDWAECLSLDQCQCTVCVRQPPTLKEAASDIAFRYVLNLEAFRMDSRVPFDRFREVATSGRVPEYRLFPYARFCIITAVTVGRKKRRRHGSIRNVSMLTHLLPSSVIGCRKLWSIELGSSRDSWKRKQIFGTQNVKLYSSR